MSNVTPLTAFPLLAILLAASAATAEQRATDPKGSGGSLRDFLAELRAQKCDDPACTRCHPLSAANGESSAADNLAATPATADSLMASAGFPQPVAAAPQEEVRASGGVSLAACRAVGLVDADTGAAAQLKGTAAAFITCLEDLRDSLIPGSTNRMTAEGHIGAVAHACDWAVSRLPKQAA